MTKYEQTVVKVVVWMLFVLGIISLGVFFMLKEFGGDISANSLPAALYATLRLFVFERDVQPFPSSWQLMVVYFIAPLFTFSVLGAFLSCIFRFSPSIRTKLCRRHVIVCGLGDTGKLLAQSFRLCRKTVIGIENRDAGHLADWSTENGIPVLQKDFRLRSTIQSAGASRAVAVVFADNDDVNNLNLALEFMEWIDREKPGYRCSVWAHVADNRLLENTTAALRTGTSDRFHVFDIYHVAAQKMLEACFGSEQRLGIKEVVVAGYGALGSDLVESLILSLSPRDEISILVLDKRDIAADVQHLVEHLGKKVSVRTWQGDIRYYMSEDSAGKAYFLCTDDDPGNLSAAMVLARNAREGNRIFVRMQQWPLVGVAEHFGCKQGITFVNVNELVHEGVREIPGLGMDKK